MSNDQQILSKAVWFLRSMGRLKDPEAERIKRRTPAYMIYNSVIIPLGRPCLNDSFTHSTTLMNV